MNDENGRCEQPCRGLEARERSVDGLRECVSVHGGRGESGRVKEAARTPAARDPSEIRASRGVGLGWLTRDMASVVNHYPVALIVLLFKSQLEIYLPNPSYAYTHTHPALRSNLLKVIVDSTQLQLTRAVKVLARTALAGCSFAGENEAAFRLLVLKIAFASIIAGCSRVNSSFANIS